MNNDGACPKCKSPDIVRAGKALRKGGKVQSYKCNDCGHVFTEEKKLMLIDVEESVPLERRDLIGMARRVK